MPDLFDDPDIVTRLSLLIDQANSHTLLLADAATAYALVEELRRLADKCERDLIRSLRWSADGSPALTWEKVADATGAQLGSRQAAHARWRRLIDPERRVTSGDARRGAAKPGSKRS